MYRNYGIKKISEQLMQETCLEEDEVMIDLLSLTEFFKEVESTCDTIALSFMDDTNIELPGDNTGNV